MSFFMDAAVTMDTKILEIIYLVTGFAVIYVGVKNLLDKENPSRIGTAVFWGILGVLIAFGRWIPEEACGALVIIMCIPAVLLMIMSRSNTPKVILNDAERMISTVGPISMLSMLIACLGTVFTEAGVGEVIAKIVGNVIPEGSVNIGIIVYALGMMLFTMIMGNAFAAITVMTVGIGGPFVLAHGVNPVLIGMLALTCGYCGTLLTPMAANFNIVPVALLEMKNRFTVIKNQVIISLIMITFQIVYMIIFK